VFGETTCTHRQSTPHQRPPSHVERTGAQGPAVKSTILPPCLPSPLFFLCRTIRCVTLVSILCVSPVLYDSLFGDWRFFGVLIVWSIYSHGQTNCLLTLVDFNHYYFLVFHKAQMSCKRMRVLRLLKFDSYLSFAEKCSFFLFFFALHLSGIAAEKLGFSIVSDLFQR